MGMKVDLSGVKSFFFERGEKVGMIACGVAAVALIAYGLVGSLGAKNAPGENLPYGKAIERYVAQVREDQNRGTEIQPLDPNVVPKDDWREVKVSFDPGSYF